MTTISSAAVVIASLVAYQVCMKTLPVGMSPISLLTTIYASALVCTLIAAPFVQVDGPTWSLSQFSWMAVFVGVAIVGVELGYLYMYRNNWTISAAPLVTMGGSAIILLCIGILVFKQPWSARYLLGIAMCATGIYLVTPKPA